MDRYEPYFSMSQEYQLNKMHHTSLLQIQGLTHISASFWIMPGIANGYFSFVIAISMIGVCTAVIGDVASHLGCFIFLKDSVNAIAFVALGTSVPGL